MNRKSLLVAALVAASALAGGTWMNAQDEPPPPAPPITELPTGRPTKKTSEKPGTQPKTDLSGTDEAVVSPVPVSEESATRQENSRVRPAVGDPDAVKNQRIERVSRRVDEAEEAAATAPNIEIADLLNKHAEQSLTIEWIGPAQIKVGQPFVYEIVVRNAGSLTASEVTVRDKLTRGMVVKQTEPAAEPDGDGYTWRLGDLEPRQEKRIKLEMVAEQRGELVCHATITATSPAIAKFRVSEPKLALKQTGPEKVMLGDPATIAIAVTNPGDGPADKVVIRSELSDGLKHEKGSSVSYELGTLAAGETRTVRLVCSTAKGGQQQVHSVATAEGGLQADAESSFGVTEPKLVATIAGPKLRYIERNATYTVTVTNPGDAAATNVKLLVNMPAGFKYAKASGGGQHDYTTRSIAWFVGDINAGEKKEVQYQCVAMQPGQHKHVAVATAQRGLRGESDMMTAVEGISALLLEVVDVDDPIEVGADTAYEIRVTNQGSREAVNVEVHALVPRELQVRGAQGPTEHRQEGQEVIFAALPRLAPRADAIYRIFVKGAGVGDVRFRARLISESLSEPVIEEESTKVYND